jgi:hypothetical protein
MVEYFAAKGGVLPRRVVANIDFEEISVDGERFALIVQNEIVERELVTFPPELDTSFDNSFIDRHSLLELDDHLIGR